MKQYSVYYESNEMVCRSNDHFYGYASSIKTARSYIGRIKKNYSKYNPRNFRIYDQWADVEDDEPIPCIYQED